MVPLHPPVRTAAVATAFIMIEFEKCLIRLLIGSCGGQWRSMDCTLFGAVNIHKMPTGDVPVVCRDKRSTTVAYNLFFFHGSLTLWRSY